MWDGLASHRDELVWLLGLPLIRKSPYNPDINPAERVFEEVRRLVELYVYLNLEDMVEAAEVFLTEFE